MNSFKFSGRISHPNEQDFIKTTKDNKKYIGFYIRQNENNSAYVSLYGKNLSYDNTIPVLMKETGEKKYIPYSERKNKNILNNISNISKYTLSYSATKFEFIWRDDFIESLKEVIYSLPQDTIYEISGDYSISYFNGKKYNNFNIKNVKVDNSLRPEFKMSLDLFYNYYSLDESDKRNKFILNSYIEQYDFSIRKKAYFPIQVQFITNRFNFKKDTDVEIIIHRKANLHPTIEEGWVKATWEAQYVRGAQLILPPLETLPTDIQFEIKNAGRDIKEYMCNVVGTASEFICLTRPNNTLNKDGKIYIPLGTSDDEFRKHISSSALVDGISIDTLAKKDALENPIN